MTGRGAAATLAALLAVLPAAGRARAASEPAVAPLTMDQAVGVALQQNRAVIAARLDIDAAQLDVVAARIYPNPIASYSAGNRVVGAGNPQQGAPGSPLNPHFFSQPVQTVGLSEIIDVWAKRSARTRAAERGVEQRKLIVEDALREIVYAVRSAFADVSREQAERELAHEIAGRYDETVRLSQARFRAGDISEAELRKVELEGLRYQSGVIDADEELDLARQKLASLMGLPSRAALPAAVVDPPELRPDFARAYSVDALVATAMQDRPDVRAAASGRTVAEAQLGAAKREALPDISLGAAYTHSDFTVSGDNPNAMALSISLPLPLFDRNQANIGRSELEIRRADNEMERLKVAVHHEVAAAVRRADRSRMLLDLFEGTGAAAAPPAPANTGGTAGAASAAGGMLSRAEASLKVAERSYKTGAISLLELLEAQRTYLDVRGQYLRAVDDVRQAAIDLNHAVGAEVK
jgi:cobalt-zinc-cadmium efflux system outer membrane protein